MNNLDARNEIGENTASSNSDDNGSSNISIGCDTNDDSNITNTRKSYVRRRKCNENVQVCEKAKKRESYRQVIILDSNIFQQFLFFIAFYVHY